MLCLLGVMLSVLCLVSPAPLTTGTACPGNALFMEAIHVLQKLRSQGLSEITPLKNKMEARGNATTYLEGFIEALKNSKGSLENSKKNLQLLVLQLRKIQTYGESCTGWMAALKEHHWNAAGQYDFFSNLEYLLRFLSHNALPDGTD